MNLFFATSVLLFTVASSTPFTAHKTISTAERHVIRHDHKINCLNCFCGREALERARHACPADRDLILCPPSIPIRICYRCSCFPRVPVSPSPPVMAPHPDTDKGNDVRKQDDTLKGDVPLKQDDHKQDDHKKDDEYRKEDDQIQAEDRNRDGDHENDDMMIPTPDEDDNDSKPPLSKRAQISNTPEPCNEPTDPRPSTFKPSTVASNATKNSPQLASTSSRSCATFERFGGGGNTMFDVDLLYNHGTFKVTWQMDRVSDKLEIFYERKKLFTTNVPVRGNGMATIKYSGSSSIITVWVTAPTTGTGWFMKIGCPNSD